MSSYRIDPSDHHPAAPGVGFATCPAERRILKARMSNYRARRLAIACPHCESVHITPDPQGRPLREDETPPALAEIAPAEGTPTARTETAAPARQRVSDAAILAELGPEPRRADEVAEALGYSEPGGLVSRIKRMNARSPERPPIILGRADGLGRAVTLKLGRLPSVASSETADHEPHNPDRERQETGSETADPAAEKREMSPSIRIPLDI